jgi:ribosome-associated translation inhibitor RaiA
MAIQAHSVEVNGLRRESKLRARVEAQMSDALARVGRTPVSGHVTFVDDNGPKGGPALRCSLTLHLPYRPALHAEHTADSRRLAFDGAFEALERRLERYRERDRDGRRHPKKYYAAKRLIEGVRRSRGRAAPLTPERSR